MTPREEFEVWQSVMAERQAAYEAQERTVHAADNDLFEPVVLCDHRCLYHQDGPVTAIGPNIFDPSKGKR